jgi:hypothetical protein
MTDLVFVIEAPFIEPGMPYPYLWNAVDLIQKNGGEAIPLDLNIKLYRSMIEDNSIIDNQALFIDCLNSASFGNCSGITGSSDHHSRDLLRDYPSYVRSNVLPFFNGKTVNLKHHIYVRNMEMINALLDYRIKKIDKKSSLWVDRFSTSVDIRFSESVFDGIKNDSGGLFDVYERYFSDLKLQSSSSKILILIREEEQLYPGLALANWLRNRTNIHITLHGRFLTQILTMNIPKELFQVCNSVILHPLEFSIKDWLNKKDHQFILNEHPPEKIKSFDSSLAKPSGEQACILDSFCCSDYLTPVPVIGAVATTRCYYGKCAFCNLANSSHYPYQQCSIANFRQYLATWNNELPGLHVQFLDHALPYHLLKNAKVSSNNINVRWAAQFRFENAFLEEDVFKKLYDLGCRALSWGVESGSEKILKRMNKGGVTNNKCRSKILRDASKAGIVNFLFILTGFSNESEQDFRETLNFLADNMDFIHGIESHAYQPIIGTAEYKRLITKKSLVKEGDWNPRWLLNNSIQSSEYNQRSDFVNNSFGSLSKMHSTNDLLEGHLAFNYLFERHRQ